MVTYTEQSSDAAGFFIKSVISEPVAWWRNLLLDLLFRPEFGKPKPRSLKAVPDLVWQRHSALIMAREEYYRRRC